jgi:hypothetical protein
MVRRRFARGGPAVTRSRGRKVAVPAAASAIVRSGGPAPGEFRFRIDGVGFR